MTVMRKSAYAVHKGWNPSTISRLLAKGVLKALPDGRLDVEESDRRILAASNPSKRAVAERNARERGDAPPPPADGTFHAARTTREGFEAELTRLKYQQAVGKLVDADDVHREQFEIYRRVAAALDQLPDRLAPMVAAETDAFVIRGLIEVEIHRIRNELADQFKEPDAAVH